MHFFLLIVLCAFTVSSFAEDKTDTLLNESKALLEQGHYFLAIGNLQSATQLTNTREQQVRIDGLLGLAYYQMHQYEKSTDNLLKALQQMSGSQDDRARWTATLAKIKFESGQVEEAENLLSTATTLADHNKNLQLGIRLEQTTLLPVDQQLQELQRIYENLNTINVIAERLPYLLNIATQAYKLGSSGQKLAYESFVQIKQHAQTSPRFLTQALSGLAQLYEDQHRYDEAEDLDEQAIQVAQEIEAHDLLLELEWRQGRLFRLLKQTTEALLAYRHAIEHVEAIRHDIPIEYHNGRSSFRETLEPIYLGLADLLLQQSNSQRGDNKTKTLYEAREVVEKIKQSEVEDFLGGRCSVKSNKTVLLEKLPPNTAILYPILLPDRLELIIGNGDEISQYTQQVDAHTVEQLAHDMAKNLRQGINNKAISQQLYRWLITPLESLLHQKQVNTLVIIPDGALRLIPLAALYDGQHYLIENYSIATSPGLTLMGSTSIPQHKSKILLAGMSKPGDVINHLPPVFFNAIASAVAKRSLTEPANNRALPIANTITTNRDLEALMRQPVFRQQMQDTLSLPGVAKEVNILSQQMPNTLLIDETFTVSNFEKRLTNEPYSVVHLASHGVFGNTADTSFIMAYDNIINVNELEKLFKSDRFKKEPLDLLTLSACQTAEGDDRAPLGISGIAIKANVGSALGTLWSVSDDAAFKLMIEFYKALQQPNIGKAQALRQAQLVLLNDHNLTDPFFWAPFILVGNWI